MLRGPNVEAFTVSRHPPRTSRSHTRSCSDDYTCTRRGRIRPDLISEDPDSGTIIETAGCATETLAGVREGNGAVEVYRDVLCE